MNRDIHMSQDLLGISHARDIMQKNSREWGLPRRHEEYYPKVWDFAIKLQGIKEMEEDSSSESILLS